MHRSQRKSASATIILSTATKPLEDPSCQRDQQNEAKMTETLSNPSKRIGKRTVTPHLLPPKTPQLPLNKTSNGKLQNSMINQLTLLNQNSPHDYNGLTPQAQQYLQIRNSQSSQKQRIDLSLSSDCLDTEYEYGYLRKKVEDLTGKLAMMVEEQCSANGEVEFYKRKAEQYLQRNKQLEDTVKQLQEEIRQREQKLSEQHGKIQEMESNLSRERTEFAQAKEVGQRQIDQLSQELQESEKQISRFKNRVFTQKATQSTTNSIVNPVSRQQSSYIKRFYEFSKRIDEKIAANNPNGPLFGGISARSHVGLTLFGTAEKDERIIQLQQQNSRLMNLIQHSCDITRSLQTCKANFFPV